MGKKKSKKKSGKKKGKKGKGDDATAGPPNHNGFTPGGEPIKVWYTDKRRQIEDTPENSTAIAIGAVVTTVIGEIASTAFADSSSDLNEDGSRDLPHAVFVRVGEMNFSLVADLKRRIYEVTKWPINKMQLFFSCPPDAGGRPIRDLLGYDAEWPWNPDTNVVQLIDDMPLSTFGILKKSERRLAAEKAALDAHNERMANDPEYKREVQKKKLLAEEARQAEAKKKGKKKSGKKKSGKGGKTGPDGKKMSEKEIAAHEAREKAKEEREKAERIVEQDKLRSWPENQVFLLLKVDGVPERAPGSAFAPHPGKPSTTRRPSTFIPPMPRRSSFHNSVAAADTDDTDATPRGVPIQSFIGDSVKQFSSLPPIRGWPQPPPPPDPNAPVTDGGDTPSGKKRSSGKKKKGSGKKKSSGKKKKK